ncbi:MarR family winged helix-turn-helix transcriptional regulator [Paenibacillus chitinolyticus]|uniref:MarR family winged helix-turn-helix transcriptional regulator n=1 Tax=Paenibacillus TaxID=44249 RepID=UPI002DB6E698|nr:MarR family transcriptional regulator [Paenibacillus chitinolyticus]MEC0244934.1 MarR family transcriptional regulator [Paenibacillus chitinolyticus]
MPEQGYLEMEQSFRQLLRKMSNEWTKYVDRSFSKSQFLILEKLVKEGPQKVSSLAEALFITAGAITGMSDKLIAGGYAERIRTEEDRRVVFLDVTDKGREMVKVMSEYRLGIIKRMMQGLTDDDMTNMSRIFAHMIDNLDKGEGTAD